MESQCRTMSSISLSASPFRDGQQEIARRPRALLAGIAKSRNWTLSVMLEIYGRPILRPPTRAAGPILLPDRLLTRHPASVTDATIKFFPFPRETSRSLSLPRDDPR